jgi:hypothetical protein
VDETVKPVAVAVPTAAEAVDVSFSVGSIVWSAVRLAFR